MEDVPEYRKRAIKHRLYHVAIAIESIDPQRADNLQNQFWSAIDQGLYNRGIPIFGGARGRRQDERLARRINHIKRPDPPHEADIHLQRQVFGLGLKIDEDDNGNDDPFEPLGLDLLPVIQPSKFIGQNELDNIVSRVNEIVAIVEKEGPRLREEDRKKWIARADWSSVTLLEEAIEKYIMSFLLIKGFLQKYHWA